MTDHNPNRPVGSGVPPERDRVGGVPPEHRGGPPRDGGNSAMALIVGALAVALIIGAFFWFAGDTQDTASLDDPTVVEEDVTVEDEPDQETTITTEENNTTVEPDTETTMADEPAEDDAGLVEETEEGAESAAEEPADGEVIDETQQ